MLLRNLLRNSYQSIRPQFRRCFIVQAMIKTENASQFPYKMAHPQSQRHRGRSDHQKDNFNRSSSIYGRALLIIGSLVFLKYHESSNDIYRMIEDLEILTLKKSMNDLISTLKNQYGQLTVYPEVKYTNRGNTYNVSFEIDQRKSDMFLLLSKVLSTYTTDKGFRVLDSRAITNKEGIVTYYVDFQEQDPQFKAYYKGRITITGLNTDERPSFRLIFEKNDKITSKNIDLLKNAYSESVKPREFAREQMKRTNSHYSNPKRNQPAQKQPQGNKLYKKLEEYGVTVFDPKDKTINLDWDYLAGYESQKRNIEDTVLLALNYPEIYDEITEATRVKFEQNRPKAVLFEGPPGTGKTTSAKIIAQQVNIPLIYMPIEAIMSKYYGESEKKLSEFWETCKNIGKVIIFIDEIDALAGSRDSDMHEASRRVLSTLLRKIDSFESTTDVLLVCATNRKQDLDAAMLSRIDLSIKFSLPDRLSRAAIFKRYAKHLNSDELQFLAESTEGFSGRNISDICKHTERKWASKLIRKEVEQRLPSLDQYIASLEERKVSELI